MKKIIAILMLVCFASVGCTGSFMLTKKVYNWHRSLGDKWSDEFGFLVCTLIPIYGLSTMADAIVFNSIEFWTGKNPVEESRAETKTKYVKVGDQEATLTYDPQSKRLNIVSQKKGLHPAAITLEKNGNTVLTKDQKGNVLYTTKKNENGDFLVYNKDSRLLKSYSQAELAQAMGDEQTK